MVLLEPRDLKTLLAVGLSGINRDLLQVFFLYLQHQCLLISLYTRESQL